MPSFSYAILQYVPDQARAERINVGVVVVGEGVAFCNARLLKKPQLAQAMRRLGYGRDTGFIEQIRREFDRDAVTGRELPGLGHTAWTVDAVSAASREWANTVQLTTPRPALHADGEVLVEELFVRLVARPRARQVGGRVQHAPRDRRWISHYVLRELRQSFEVQRPGIDVDTYVTVDVDVRGKYDEHRFDLQLENGHPLDLVRGLAKKTQEEIDSVAWAIDDLQKADNHVPVTVVSIGSGKLLDSAERIYGDLGARLVREREVDQWCEAATGKLLTALAG